MSELIITKTGENKSFNYDERFNKLTNLTENKNLLITKNENIYYQTGYKGSAGRLFILNGEKYLFVDTRYFEYASTVAHKTNVVLSKHTYDDTLFTFVRENKVDNFVIAKEGLLLDDYENIKKKLEGLNVNISVCDKSIDNLRVVKEKEEIEIIKNNLLSAEAALTKTLPFIKEGITEKDLAAELEYRMRLEGGDKSAFDTILLFGERSSLPHGVPSERKLKCGDNILMDFGLSRDGYKSDITRTFFFGKGSNFEEMSKIYSIVKKAHNNAMEKICTGMSGIDADNKAREIIVGSGYGNCFGHGLGHGVGLEIHEAPRVSFLSDKPLEGGAIITIEPGIYKPLLGGVRIENMAIITKDKCVSLNSTPTDLVVI